MALITKQSEWIKRFYTADWLNVVPHLTPTTSNSLTGRLSKVYCVHNEEFCISVRISIFQSNLQLAGHIQPRNHSLENLHAEYNIIGT